MLAKTKEIAQRIKKELFVKFFFEKLISPTGYVI